MTATARLIGVGVGPGDPELVTLRALRVLREADRVVAPTLSAGTAGRAESIVRRLEPDLRIERVVFAMVGDDQPDRAASHEAAAAALGPWLDAGETVAFVTLGDPNIYSTFSALVDVLERSRPGLDVATVPGITAFQDLASRSGTVLLDGDESLSLVTAVAGPAAVASALAEPDRAVVVYKGGRHLPDIARAAAGLGRQRGAVVGELLGLPGERMRALADAAGEPASYLATIVFPPVGRPGTAASAPPGRPA